MNERLYYQDPYLTQCTARIERRGRTADGTPYLVLDRTVFYPTGGGQPCDEGTVNGIRVTQVEETEEEVRHYLGAELPDGLVEVTAVIDWSRRFDHMQQHAGQHILSASFAEVLQAETVAFHLGKERVTIDVTLTELTEELAEEVERLANRIVVENRPIQARFVEEAELAAMPLRKPPTVTENVRVVVIPDFDYNPCGGTHPARTGEVGPIKILDWERHRGNIRVAFVCGYRALEEFTRKHRVLRQLTRQLSSSEAELTEQAGRLMQERNELQQRLQQKEKQLLTMEAEQLLAKAVAIHGAKVVEAILPDRPLQELQKLAQIVTGTESDAIVLFAASSDKLQLVFARGEKAGAAMNELLKETLPLVDGKGGGSPMIAQGGGAAIRSADEVLSFARERLVQLLATQTTGK